MTQVFLNLPDVDPAHQEMGGKGNPKNIWVPMILVAVIS